MQISPTINGDLNFKLDIRKTGIKKNREGNAFSNR